MTAAETDPGPAASPPETTEPRADRSPDLWRDPWLDPPPDSATDPWAGGRPAGAGITHRGLVRRRNEDSILTDPGGTLWAVSDGMGGHGHGDVASDLVIDALAALTDAEADADPEGALRLALARADAAVRARAAALGAPGMGATVVAAVLSGGAAHLLWAGDSRAYLLRDGALGRLTRDHTLVQELVERGEVRPEDAARHPEAHVVTRAVGGGDRLEPEARRLPLRAGDRLLLCSDGLTGAVPEAGIAAALGHAPSPEEACRRLLLDALEAGAPDNVSVIALGVGA